MDMQNGGQIITLRGRNLNAGVRTNVRLFQGIIRHRVPWIQEADEPAAMESQGQVTLVEEIDRCLAVYHRGETKAVTVDQAIDHFLAQAGFTLMEMSIVLVIIGLLVGGVLVGRDLINAAALRDLITEREKILTGVNTFRLKYNGLPGDLNNAENFWGTDPGGCPNTAYNTTKKTTTCNGNGNGIIEGSFTPSTCAYPNSGPNREVHRFWQHLSSAGFLETSVTGATGGALYFTQTLDINAPRSRYGSDVGISTGGTWGCTPVFSAYFPVYHGFVLFVGKQTINQVTFSPFLPPLRASAHSR